MKKIISTLLAVLMVTSAFVTTSFAANDTTDMQKILASVKERITVPENLTAFDYNTQSNGNVTQFYFNWTSTDKTKSDNMSVTCDASGVITGYHYYTQDDMNYKDDPSFPKTSREDAKVKAKEFIEKINPDWFSQIKILDEVSAYDTPLYSNSHNFNVIRTVNGIEFMDNSGNISVNSDNGKVTDFNIQWWSGVSFADNNKIISSDEAIKVYNDKLGLKLVYKAASDGEKKTVYPAYIRTDNNKFIDANTGEVFQREYGIYRFNNKSESMGAGGRGMDAGAVFTPEEIEKINEISDLISPADAEKIIRSNKYIAVSTAAKVRSSNLSKDNYMADGYIYNLNFEDGDSNSWNATVDAKTGAILSFYKYNSKQNNTDLNISKEKAEKVALQVMKDIMGDKYSQYKFSDEYLSGTVNFTRIVNGIEYVNNAGSVSVDNNGGIINFSYSYTDDEFPSIDGVMTKEQALQYLIKDNFDLYYVGENRSDKGGWGEPTDKARLVYTTENSNDTINPFTGEFLDYNGKPVKDTSVKEYTDIKGHYAEKQILALAKSGVGFEGDKFLPDQPILQKEFIALLMSVFNRWSGPIPLYDSKIIDQAYQQAGNMGVITEEEKNSEAVVTRESAAKFFIRAMGIEKYASLNIYNCPFPDVTNYKGQISILYGLGVIGGDNNGNFNPNNVLSRADASIMIYNYLNK